MCEIKFMKAKKFHKNKMIFDDLRSYNISTSEYVLFIIFAYIESHIFQNIFRKIKFFYRKRSFFGRCHFVKNQNLDYISDHYCIHL